MKEVFDAYIKKLYELFLFDIGAMSQPWMYWCVIPIVVYTVFFLIKWTLLTAPLWLPVSLAFSSIINIFKKG